jgi:hypothetical protein
LSSLSRLLDFHDLPSTSLVPRGPGLVQLHGLGLLLELLDQVGVLELARLNYALVLVLRELVLVVLHPVGVRALLLQLAGVRRCL